MPGPTSEHYHYDDEELTLHDADDLLDPAARARRRSPLRILASVFSWAFVVVSLLALAVFGIGPQTGAYRTLTVLSGSMVPAFHPGDVVIAQKKAPKQVKVGDIIIFNAPVGDHRVTTHRVVRIYSAGKLPLVQTKGDANDSNDAFKLQLQGNELWYVTAHVPLFGYVIHALRQPLMKVLAFGCLGLLALVFLWNIWSSGEDEEEDDELGLEGT